MTQEDHDKVNGETFSTTEIAERLAGPQGAGFARELRERLERLEAQVRGEMRSGVPGGQLEAYSQVADALASAASVVVGAADAKSRQGVLGGTP